MRRRCTAGVRRFPWDDERIPLARTVAAIATSARLFDEHGFGLWGAWSTQTARLAGFTGLWHFRDPPDLELLYGVAEDSWNSGYATELAGAVVRYGFEVLDMPVIRASTDAANTASVRVLEKLGFHLTRRDVVAGLDTVFYARQRRGGDG